MARKMKPVLAMPMHISQLAPLLLGEASTGRDRLYDPPLTARILREFAFV